MSSATHTRLFLSPPDIGSDEQRFVAEAFATNWVAPAGPHLAAFEREMCAASGAKAAVAVSSGTAALHLALRLVGMRPGDEVFCSTFTFVGSANPILYEGGRPVFVDAERRTWNMDPALLADALAQRARTGRLPRAIIVADIYGQCADWEPLLAAAAQHQVPIIEDAAEAVGALYRGRWAGTFGRIGVYSFNGNKILTTSGGGMVLSAEPALVDRAHKLATQAREAAPHYEHAELGYNYRLSNVLAGIGRGQLRGLPERIARRRALYERYRAALGDLPGVEFRPEPPGWCGTRWLTCLLVDGRATRDAVLAALEADNIEARPLWKPLHRQPLYAEAECIGGAVAEDLFTRGLCLPSGSGMTDSDLQRVVRIVRGVFGHA
ncbi:MAG TPA: aminotransferase class I/II-fold pyridoxal phosphate-dependent enzyme [Opitutaceae bacterium]|nr:aminotransferase class I/II-fold pyridoxal phosphate-dependent enzyme [Opitutaceae bacterium]